VKKLLVLLPVLAFSINVLFAQDDELPPPSSKPQPTTQPTPQPNAPDQNQVQGFSKPKKLDLSKFIIEPNFNFGIGSGIVNVGVSPYVGYNVWKDLYLGGGITYLYTGYSGIPVYNILGTEVGTATAHTNTYGAGVFAQYNIWRGVFARAKFEMLHSDADNITPNLVTNAQGGYSFPMVHVTIPDLLLGVGYNLLRNKNFFFPIIVSYNVLYPITNTTYSIYPHGLVIQLGFVNVF